MGVLGRGPGRWWLGGRGGSLLPCARLILDGGKQSQLQHAAGGQRDAEARLSDAADERTCEREPLIKRPHSVWRILPILCDSVAILFYFFLNLFQI